VDSEYITKIIRDLYGNGPIQLHKPFIVKSSEMEGSVDKFEELIESVSGEYVVSTISGTAALHLALLIEGVKPGDKVITSPLTFVATCNAIAYCGAEPVFVDIEQQTLGMDPNKLEAMLSSGTFAAVLPVHAFGHSPRMDAIDIICSRHGVPVIEDACQAFGSWYKGRHSGTWGHAGVFSFNWNKTITSGGGGAIITNDADFAKRARHLHNVARTDDPLSVYHDEIGFNYRLSGLNASFGCEQMEKLPEVLSNKRSTAELYSEALHGMFREPNGAKSNYWLNTLILNKPEEVPLLLKHLKREGIEARPAWTLMHRLPIYEHCQKGDLSCAESIAPRIVNLPSGVRW
jgi:perosamine synthetase